MVVSLKWGTPKSSLFMGFSIINQPFWGTPIYEPPIFFHLFPVNPQFFPSSIPNWSPCCWPPSPARCQESFQLVMANRHLHRATLQEMVRLLAPGGAPGELVEWGGYHWSNIWGFLQMEIPENPAYDQTQMIHWWVDIECGSQIWWDLRS